MAPIQKKEILDVNENRKAIYAFLATMYAKELTKPLLLDLAAKKNFFHALAEQSETEGTELAEGFKVLEDFAKDVKEEALDDIQLQLAIEYAGLFLGVWKVPPHPSESAYSNPDHLIMQKPRDDAMMLYKTMGMEKNTGFTEPEDHVALQLQFMARLSGKTAEAISTGDQADAKKYLEVQRDFLNNHLARWIPLLVVDILKSGRREFYKAVAKVTRGFVEMDRQIVPELIDMLTTPAQADATIS
jgi:TorA maturation chaperone TorD